MNLKKIVVKNINALRAITPGVASHKQIARAAALRHHKVSSRAIGTLLQDGNSSPPTLDTLDAVAHAYNVPAWLLLTADFDATLRTGGAIPTTEEMELLRAINESAALRKILRAPAADRADGPYKSRENVPDLAVAQPKTPYPKFHD